MIRRTKSLMLLALVLISAFMISSGVFAQWVYYTDASAVDHAISTHISRFVYGEIYITSVSRVNGGRYDSASLEKTAATDVSANIDLSNTASSSVSFEVTFYNGTDTTYYYNEAQTVSSDNNAITYQVSGIAQKDAINPKTYKTVTITFSYKNGISSDSTLDADIHFNFVVDKDSIGIVVARTAVDRFRDILNNVAFSNSYDTLDSAMSSHSNASTVTYIGNVSGSSSSDTQVVERLFGQEFMAMDLDGDGKTERITMMIKRENLDGNNLTGASYTYRSLFSEKTVHGVEMTLYITAEDVSARSVTVYAATFTIPEGGSQWVEIVPLTKGTASTNNYSSGIIGSKNSFNTDTWESDGGKSIDTLVKEAMN